MSDQTIFDALEAQRKADQTIAQVEANADGDWLIQAHKAVRVAAERFSEFTTDEVWQLIPPTRENRALGPVMKKAARAGIIEKTDRVRNGKRVSRHGAPLAIWRSRAAE